VDDIHRQIVYEIKRAIRFLGAEPEAMRLSTPKQCYEALEKLGAHPHLLANVGSWKDTLSDEDVLETMKTWNAEQIRIAPRHSN
jgi:hypothetical protein